ncbi:MAG TPA: FAD binding domain-containing protein [Thermoleophilia bacterium]|nr:FAD binding domain-containing protein [Thermoleophilia bacterium]
MSDVTMTEVRSPSTMDELVAALAQATPRTRLLAGGTDLVRALRGPEEEPDVLIDLSCLDELKAVRLDGETLQVGALATFQQLQWDPLAREHAYCLSLAAAQVGSAQIRNAGTIGGNVANASPCADGVTALTVLGAEVTTVDGAGATRSRPIGEVVLGPSRTSLAYDEAITGFAFPALGPEHRSAFSKIGSRTAVSVARLSCALVVRFDAAAGTLASVRVALGAVGETAFRAPDLELALEGRLADEETARLFAGGCVAAVQESIPGRYSLPYKQHAALGLAYDAWNMLALSAPCEPAWA